MGLRLRLELGLVWGQGQGVSWDGYVNERQKYNDSVCVNVCLCVMAVILPEPIRWPGFEVK